MSSTRASRTRRRSRRTEDAVPRSAGAADPRQAWRATWTCSSSTGSAERSDRQFGLVDDHGVRRSRARRWHACRCRPRSLRRRRCRGARRSDPDDRRSEATPSRPAHSSPWCSRYTPSMPCALPLTGSSGTPMTGQNMRDSVAGCAERRHRRANTKKPSAPTCDVRCTSESICGCSESSIAGDCRPISSRVLAVRHHLQRARGVQARRADAERVEHRSLAILGNDRAERRAGSGSIGDAQVRRRAARLRPRRCRRRDFWRTLPCGIPSASSHAHSARRRWRDRRTRPRDSARRSGSRHRGPGASEPSTNATSGAVRSRARCDASRRRSARRRRARRRPGCRRNARA